MKLALSPNLNLSEIATVAMAVHAQNVAAGWWTDLKTGVSTLHTRNRAELLMLTVSELSEADFGYEKPDDKLPQYMGHFVELGDAVIRVLDQIGAYIAVHFPGTEKPPTFSVREYAECVESIHLSLDATDDSSTRNGNKEVFSLSALYLVNVCSCALENVRKQQHAQYYGTLLFFVHRAFYTAELFGLPHEKFVKIMEDKIAFNMQRADHKPENRIKDGGKKC